MPQPDIISRYYRHSNCIDMANQLRQDCLGLERQWVTYDGYFRMITGLIGMSVVDVYKLGQHHGFLPRGKNILNFIYTIFQYIN